MSAEGQEARRPGQLRACKNATKTPSNPSWLFVFIESYIAKNL